MGIDVGDLRVWDGGMREEMEGWGDDGGMGE